MGDNQEENDDIVYGGDKESALDYEDEISSQDGDNEEREMDLRSKLMSLFLTYIIVICYTT